MATVKIGGQGVLQAATIPAEICYFQCVGYYSDIENPDLTGSTNVPLQNIITGLVTFHPRVPNGTVLYLANLDLTNQSEGYTHQHTAVGLAPIVARILSGQLQSINVGDSPGVSLLANTPNVSAALIAAGVPSGILIWDIAFSSVVFGEAAQQITNFAITAPTSPVTISLTDPALVRLPYLGP